MHPINSAPGFHLLPVSCSFRKPRRPPFLIRAGRALIPCISGLNVPAARRTRLMLNRSTTGCRARSSVRLAARTAPRRPTNSSLQPLAANRSPSRRRPQLRLVCASIVPLRHLPPLPLPHLLPLRHQPSMNRLSRRRRIGRAFPVASWAASSEAAWRWPAGIFSPWPPAASSASRRGSWVLSPVSA